MLAENECLGKISKANIILDRDFGLLPVLDLEFSTELGSCWMTYSLETLTEIMTKAKLRNFKDIINTPIAVIIDKGILKNFRVLEEVI